MLQAPRYTFCVLRYNVPMRYLGIDYGTKRVGIALTDESGSIAFPHSIIPNSLRLGDEIMAICKKEDVKLIIMGESRDYKGNENTVMEGVHRLRAELQEKCGVDVIFEPELLTSAEAERIQGKNDKIDASAAAIILQSYLRRIDHDYNR